MLSHSYATGHGDTIEDLLDELETQITERSRHVDEPEWTARLAHIDQRTPVEKQVADLEYAIEHLGAHPLLTDALNAADLAMRTLGKWYDEGEPGRSTAEPGVEGDAKPVAWMADFTVDGGKLREVFFRQNPRGLEEHFPITPLYTHPAPLEVEAVLRALLKRDERNTCQHEETHRGGFLWEICDQCGAKWADDEGGKPEWADPPEWVAARALLKLQEGGR